MLLLKNAQSIFEEFVADVCYRPIQSDRASLAYEVKNHLWKASGPNSDTLLILDGYDELVDYDKKEMIGKVGGLIHPQRSRSYVHLQMLINSYGSTHKHESY